MIYNNLDKEISEYTFEKSICYILEFISSHNKISINEAKACIKILPSLNKSYPKNEIDKVIYKKTDNGKISIEVYVNTYSLFGVLSPLPYYLVEILELENLVIIQKILSQFNSQSLKWLPELVKKYRHYYIYKNNPNDKISKLIASFIGIKNSSDIGTCGKILKYSGLIRQKAISKSSVEVIIRHYLNKRDVEIKEHIKRTIYIDKEHCNKLGKDNTLLSRDIVLGTKIIDISSKYAIVIKNVSIAEAYKIKKDKKIITDICNVLKLTSSEPLIFEIHLYLNEKVAFSIGINNHSELAYFSWLGKLKQNKPILIKGSINE